MKFEKKYFFILTHSNYTHTQYNLTEINTHIGTQAAYDGMLFSKFNQIRTKGSLLGRLYLCYIYKPIMLKHTHIHK